MPGLWGKLSVSMGGEEVCARIVEEAVSVSTGGVDRNARIVGEAICEHGRGRQ